MGVKTGKLNFDLCYLKNRTNKHQASESIFCGFLGHLSAYAIMRRPTLFLSFGILSSSCPSSPGERMVHGPFHIPFLIKGILLKGAKEN